MSRVKRLVRAAPFACSAALVLLTPALAGAVGPSIGAPRLARDIAPGAAGSKPYPLAFDPGSGRTNVVSPGLAGVNPYADLDGTVLFSAYDAVHGRELWRSDGTEGGTVLVKDIASGSSSGIGASDLSSEPVTWAIPWATSAPTVNGSLLFEAFEFSGVPELWRTDGTETGTTRVKVFVGGSILQWFAPFAGSIYFTAHDGFHGYELWKTDGTEGGTALVKDVNTTPLEPGNDQFTHGSGPEWTTATNRALFFTADDSVHGRELWRTDGSSGGTELVADIDPFGSGASDPADLTNVTSSLDSPGTLFFTADDGLRGRELWRSDGTEASTTIVRDIDQGFSGSGPSDLTNVGGTLYFTADDGTHGRRLWRSDGTSAGTVPVADAAASPYDLAAAGGTLYFGASDAAHGVELWKSDGTASGTVLVEDIAEGSTGSYPSNLTNVNGTLAFSAGGRLWQSDGTAVGTYAVGDAPGSPDFLTAAGGRLFFAGTDPEHGQELWSASARLTTVTVTVTCVPGGDPGSFAVSVYPTAGAEAIGVATVPCGGSHVFSVPGTGSYDVVERGAGTTSMGAYSTAVGADCTLADDEVEFRVATLAVADGDAKACSITNVRFDSDGDGIHDPVDTAPSVPSAAFDDGAGTSGSITGAGGLPVEVSDAPRAADGVHVAVGPGEGQAALSVCGFAVTLAPASDVVLTCGSITVTVTSGQAQVVLGGGISVVTVPAGGSAKVSETAAGGYSVENLGSIPVSVTIDGVRTSVAPGATSSVGTWHFVGFGQPVDNGGVLNLAKAGKTVPLKWRLLDSSGVPVTTLSSARVFVQSLACTAATTVDGVEEYASGASGLQNLGEGYYQFNWATPAGYAGSCKTLNLDLGEGITRTARFQFTR